MKVFKIITVLSVLLTVLFMFQFITHEKQLSVKTVTSELRERVVTSPGDAGGSGGEVEATPEASSPPLIFGVCTFAELTELIKALTPLLLPIITWRFRKSMDDQVRKVGIGNRRKQSMPVTNDRRKK